MPETFAAYDAVDLQRALFATLDLFRQLARDVARQIVCAYPVEADQFVDKTLHSIL